MKEIYILSGLGVDERVFVNIDFSGVKTIFIRWIVPLKNETIGDYARRLTQQIKTQNPILLGLSFGGMMAIEVAKHIDTEKIILISSVKTADEIPFYIRFIGRTGIHRIVPVNLLRKGNYLTYWFFGIKTIEEKLMLKAILKDTNPVLIKWAINNSVNWRNKKHPENTIHIHGNNDRLLPLRHQTTDRVINGGGHFMIFNKADELSYILKKIIEL